MTEKSRVLILTTAYLPQVGGSELAIKNITDRLPGIYFDLITPRPSKGLPEYEKVGNINVYRVGNSLSRLSFLLPKSFFPVAVFLKACQLIHKHGRYDIIHAYQASQAAGGGWLLKWRYLDIPFLVTVQEGKELNKQSLLTRFFRYLIFGKVDEVTAISIKRGQTLFKRSGLTLFEKMVPRRRIELPTPAFSGLRSTTELPRH